MGWVLLIVALVVVADHPVAVIVLAICAAYSWLKRK